MTKQTEVFNKYHRYEFAHGDDADFIAYQRHRAMVSADVSTWMIPR
jgi:hypothetical protein